MTRARQGTGTLALVGGGEWQAGSEGLDSDLLARSGGTEVVVLPTAAAFEHPGRVVERATTWFERLGATVRPLMVLNRREAESDDAVHAVAEARFLYLSDGSPLHLRSVLKDSRLMAAVLDRYRRGAVLAASGAGATVLCDPMVDPRGGAYMLGLGVVSGLAVFPYHGTAAAHLRARSRELQPADAVLAGIDEGTALVRDPDGTWRAEGRGAVTLYRVGIEPEVVRDAAVGGLPA